MQKTALIIKSKAFKAKTVGKILSEVEKVGFEIFDAFLLKFTRQNILDLFETQADFPAHEDYNDFLEGPCLVVGLQSDKLPELTKKLQLDSTVPAKILTVTTKDAIQFLFGAQDEEA